MTIDTKAKAEALRLFLSEMARNSLLPERLIAAADELARQLSSEIDGPGDIELCCVNLTWRGRITAHRVVTETVNVGTVTASNCSQATEKIMSMILSRQENGDSTMDFSSFDRVILHVTPTPDYYDEKGNVPHESVILDQGAEDYKRFDTKG